MAAESTQAIVLRDSLGAIYLLTQDVLESGRVPEAQLSAVQAACSGEVAGYLFDRNTLQNAFTGLSQNNTNVGGNVLIGGFLGGNSQALSQAGINVGNASTTQVTR